MVKTVLNDARFKDIAIRILHRDKMIDFYRNVLKFRLLGEENAMVFFGVGSSKEVRFTLEESPAEHARAVRGLPKLSVFNIHIPNEQEFLATVQTIYQRQLVILDIWQKEETFGIVLKDPENNQVSLTTGVNVGARPDDAQTIDIREILAQKSARIVYWKEGYIDYVELNVPNLAESKKIYELAFHATFDEKDKAKIITGVRPFQLALKKEQGEDLIGSVDCLWDIEYLEILVATHEKIELLAEYFRKVDKDFYVDKSHSVLTLHDASGIEWWFTIK